MGVVEMGVVAVVAVVAVAVAARRTWHCAAFGSITASSSVQIAVSSPRSTSAFSTPEMNSQNCGFDGSSDPTSRSVVVPSCATRHVRVWSSVSVIAEPEPASPLAASGAACEGCGARGVSGGGGGEAGRERRGAPRAHILG